MPDKGEPTKKASVNNQGRSDKSGRITFDHKPQGSAGSGGKSGKTSDSTSKKGK